MPVQLDIRNPEAVKEAVDRVEAELGYRPSSSQRGRQLYIPGKRLSANVLQTIIDI